MITFNDVDRLSLTQAIDLAIKLNKEEKKK